MKRFLITTPIEETWKMDRPILFLGEWCLPYPLQLSHFRAGSEIVPYHWDDRRQLFDDYQYLCSRYDVTLGILSKKLNEIHNVDHSVRYWRILIGPWLGQFMLMFFDRWKSVNKAVSDYESLESIVLSGCDDHLTPNDMDEFNALFPSDEWNHYIYALILEYFPLVELYRHQRNQTVHFSVSTRSSSFKTRIINILGPVVSHFGNLFSDDRDVFLLSTGLTIREEILLSLQLGQFPRLLRSVKARKVTNDHNYRDWTLESNAESKFEVCLSSVIPKQIPKMYLEGYKDLVNQAHALPWPKRPKAIWTSNSFHSDEVFKVWAADKVESGSPLLIGQHGGHYGMGLWDWGERHEISICDRYMTWGWSHSSTAKLRSVGKIKCSRPVKRNSEESPALLVTVMIQRYGNPTLSMYTSSQWLRYLQDQFNFVDALPSSIQNELIVRLYQWDYGWQQVNRWRDRFPRIQISDGSSSIKKLMRNSRLFISTYNATTYLESLSMNIPTVIYWNPEYMETNDWAQPYFDELKSVGIFHETPQSAAHHVQKIWNDIPSWWTNPKTRLVRDRFVKQFAYCPENKIDKIKSVISEVINQ